MSVAGDIRGYKDIRNSLRSIQKGGELRFNGQAHVDSWDIKPEATLSGNSAITLYGDAPMHNAGTIAPGNSIGSITINGDFTNTGTLAMEFDSKGATDTLSVTGNFQHDNAGTVNLNPVPDFYNGSVQINMADLFSGGVCSSDNSRCVRTLWTTINIPLTAA